MNITREILFEFFFGRATTLQKRAVEEWRNKPGNEEFYFQCLEEWENTYPQHRPDAERALATYRQFMQTHPAGAQPDGQKLSQPVRAAGRSIARWYWMAASLVLVGLGAGWLWQSDLFRYQTYTTRYGETRTILLADNSQVVLNANSSLRVPRDLFASTSREVWLTGEGFFSVARHTTRQRFVVHTDQLTVEVLGTKFNITDRRGSARIVLEEGRVKVTPAADTVPVLMQPGELVEVAPSSPLLRKKKVDPGHFSAWRENKLIFRETPLVEVLQTIEDYYGIDLVLEDTTHIDEQFTGVLPNDDLAVILRSLSRTYGFTIYRDKKQIRLQ
jgi:ferric-dicitrate binding protein FerR (iron transport regulator)